MLAGSVVLHLLVTILVGLAFSIVGMVLGAFVPRPAAEPSAAHRHHGQH